MLDKYTCPQYQLCYKTGCPPPKGPKMKRLTLLAAILFSASVFSSNTNYGFTCLLDDGANFFKHNGRFSHLFDDGKYVIYREFIEGKFFLTAKGTILGKDDSRLISTCNNIAPMYGK